ncbi:hypothetical protein CK486_02170 [Pseudomonas sp. HAR-UPW-AIA-41]|uniref:YggL 50S ribosome-binding family protein n=1 Tax=Pseudomonas sp. HAR-UPW-AIA-41 TaxID=1985301 RepID=UPI000BB3071A|nr:50S ribosome-binding protein YggL [Pseudomonas sp. HAR-UPW-AIA-41]PAV49590.1 hypothetical protein CK486_02170 [Pseudomonas sp. HAR-UPW-AIA-41]
MATRSRRLRKKLCVEEFQELGFELAFTFADSLSDDDYEAFFNAFLDQVEDTGLVYSGCDEFGFVCLAKRGSVSAEQRQALDAWLKGRKELQSYSIGELVDAWYPDVPVNTQA